jgi:magnesium-transporting ATPase (P-type)
MHNLHAEGGAAGAVESEATASVAADAWHARPARDALDRLQSSRAGLSEEEAARRLERCGANALPKGGGNEALTILLRQIRDPLIYVLLASTGLAILTGKVVDGLVIGGVVVLNALIGFVQEYRASQAIEALTTMVPTEVVAVRGGRKRSLSATELVPGDIVLLQSGDKVPADLRLIEQRGLRVEEAALTGESVPVEKATEPVPEDAVIGDRRSIAYSGTLVTAGTATAVVVATGPETELGRISRMLGEASKLETPLTRQLGVIARWIAVAIVLVSIVLLGIGLLRGYALADAVLAAVALAVAAIPEGAACHRHHRSGHRRAAHGPPAGDHPEAAGGGNAGLDHGDLHRQDRYADAQRDDRSGAVDAGRSLSPRRHRLRAGGRTPG